MAKNKRKLPLQRECGQCRACCTTQRVNEMVDPHGLPPEKSAILLPTPDSRPLTLYKPADVPCPHLAEDLRAKGCSIYPHRPDACKRWVCEWRSGSSTLLGSERPDWLGVVFEAVRREGVPFTYLVGVSADSKDAPGTFLRAEATIKRIVSQGHLVVCEHPDGYQDVYGPPMKVATYTAVSRKGEA